MKILAYDQLTCSRLMPIVILVLYLRMPTVSAVELFNLLPTTAPSHGDFGRWTSISANTAIVGTAELFGDIAGTAHLFDATTGLQITKLLPRDDVRGDWFGWSVGISGNTAIVGAHRDSIFNNNSGSAYVFDITSGEQTLKLTPSDGAGGDWFGYSVGISGNTAVVGANRDDDNGSVSGSAYLFNATTGSQIAKLTPSDGEEGDWFGFKVAISGNTAIVGSIFDDDSGNDSGSAYLFDITTGEQTLKLMPSDGAEGDWFGYSVGISGNTAIVGARNDDDLGNDSGSAYLFDITTGFQIAKLTPSDGNANDFFGYSVAISGNTAIVGSIFDDDSGNESGSAYLFDITTGEQTLKLIPSDGTEGDWFGHGVGISGSNAIVGANRDDSGSAYLFVVPEPDTFTLVCFSGMFGFIVTMCRRRK